MRKLTRIMTATVTAASLACVAAPAAIAQETPDSAAATDAEATNESPASSTEKIGDITDSLDQASEALSGPVKVVRNGENVTITYTNETDKAQQCSGMALPYDKVQKHDLQNLDMANIDAFALLEVFTEILGEGNSAVFGYAEGKPKSVSGAAAADDLLTLGLSGAVFASELPTIEAGQSQSWTVTEPKEEAVGVIICDGAVLDGVSPTIHKGIEQGVLFNQLKDKLGPAGSAVDLSSENPVLAGSVVSGVPFLSAFIKIVQIFFGGIFDLFSGLLGGIKLS